jgi:branched-chain amino acid transport system substrate-binding protein
MSFVKRMLTGCAALMTFVLLVIQGTPAMASTSASRAWAVHYVGGKAAAANGQASPFTVGVVEPIGSAAGGYPGLSGLVQAAKSYVNQQLNGVSGHPVKFIVCPVTSEQDAQSCGEQFANNSSIDAVVNGVTLFDDTAELKAIAAKGIPVFFPIAITPGQLGATNGAFYGPGVTAYFPAIAQYMAHEVSGTGKSAAVLYPENSGGTETEQLIKSLLTADNVTNVTYVPVPIGGTAPQYTSAVQAAGVAHASVVFVGGNDTTCIAINDAMKSLGVSSNSQQLLTSNACLDSLALKHYGGHLPTNWRVFNFGDSYLIPGLETGVDSYLAAVKQYAPTADPGTPAALMFGAIMTMDKVANSVGYQNITNSSLTKAMLSFQGPAFMEPGPMECGYMKASPSVCGNQTVVDRWTGKKWSESVVQVGPSLAQ